MKSYLVKTVRFNDVESEVQCPVCGHNYVHHNSVAFSLASNDDYKANPRVRGDVIVIPSYCESGCLFNLLFGLHKGVLRLWAEDRDSNPTNDPTFPHE